MLCEWEVNQDGPTSPTPQEGAVACELQLLDATVNHKYVRCVYAVFGPVTF